MSSPTTAGKDIEATPVKIVDKEDLLSDQDDIDALEALAAVEDSLSGGVETPTEKNDSNSDK